MKSELVKNNLGTYFEDPLLFTPDLFLDERGFFMESWNKKTFNQLTNNEINFVQDNHSKSRKNVIRGLHYQLHPFSQGKLVRCISGKIYDVLVDLRQNSKTFLNWAGIYLDSNKQQNLWIPNYFAHGFLTLSENAEIIYKTTSYYSKKHERSIRWNDKLINIEWPLNGKVPSLSEKDLNSPLISNIVMDDFFL